MNAREDRRRVLVERMAGHVLAHGLGAASLRPLAAAAGTSDRMLLYYFADKEEVLGAVLAHVAAGLTAQLDAALPLGRPRAADRLLREVWAALRSPEVAPSMHLWLDLAAAAARGQQPHLALAGAIADGFLSWTAARLEPSADGATEAARLLATIEGMLVLEAVGRGALAEAALGG